MQLVAIKRNDGNEDIVEAYDVLDFPYERLNSKAMNTKKKKPLQYIYQFATFDIESTTMTDAERPYGFMYHWQMNVGGIVCIGRTWEQWIDFMNRLDLFYGLSQDKRLVIYVHNLGFEFQFMYQFLEEYFGGYEIFARAPRQPIKVTTSNGFEFRCSYILTNMTLAKACDNELGVIHPKAKGDLDYRITRTAMTKLSPEELGYCVSDVVCLYELIENRLKNEHDNLETIPITSTGYVRRECRRACRKNPHYFDFIKKLEPSLEVYTLLKEAGRGGNTHANRYMAGRVWENCDSFDVASSYPAQMLMRLYPVSKFSYYGEIESVEEFLDVLEQFACLFRVTFKGLKVKRSTPMPYIPISKCYAYDHTVLDNGRVLSGNISMTITDIDFKIIEQEYSWEGMAVSDMHTAYYGYLPEELRKVVLGFFDRKTILKDEIAHETDDEALANLNYLYGKSKNRLNGIFGMTYTDPIRTTISMDSEGKWHEESPADLEKTLHKVTTSRNNFLYYAWGVWITCWARLHLENLINATNNGADREEGGACIYVDTDSSKCINPDLNLIEKMNAEIRAKADELGAFSEVNGKRYYMGVYEHENEKPIINFKTLGAKKYCYTDEKGFHITISGVEKKKGAQEMGSIENFVAGFTFKEAGGLNLYYNPEEIHQITIDGCTMTTASNIGLTDSTYVLGLTDEYAELIGYNLYLDS